MHLLLTVAILVATVAVERDARRLDAHKGALPRSPLDMSPTGWALFTLLLSVIALPCYLCTRPRYTAIRRGTAPAVQRPVPGLPPTPPPLPALVSEDGHWWWDGEAWQPVPPKPVAPQPAAWSPPGVGALPTLPPLPAPAPWE